LLAPSFDRRRFLQVAAGGVTAAALVPWHALAASGTYEAMVLACIDPRLQAPVSTYTARRHLTGKYSQSNHRDCGAAKIAYGAAAVADPAAETKTHRDALAAFRKQLAERYPRLGIETGLMALDGTFEVMS
jgi:hypothetical protein